MSAASHIFALYSAQAPIGAPGSVVTLEDPLVIQRLTRVLRADKGQECIIFNALIHTRLLILSIKNKKYLDCQIISIDSNVPLKPAVEWWLPLLEREAWEEALSFLTVLGATSVQPLTTAKVHRTQLYEREYERMRRLMVAAAEQSKQYVLPEIKPLLSLNQALKQLETEHVSLFFDPLGLPALQLINSLQASKPTLLRCLVGPEGDLTESEKQELKNKNFLSYALTGPILRSPHAVAIGLGLIRCLV